LLYLEVRMSQLNFYVPDEIEEQIKKAAKKEGKSISAFLSELVKAKFKPKTWSDSFFSELAGGWDGNAPEIDRPKPQGRDNL
jgi:hypothetical protein